MVLKIIIVVLFIALTISLFTGLSFLFKDQGAGRRQWYALGVRLILAVLLMAVLVYGVFTGQLGSNAPWDQRRAVDVELQQQ